MESTLQKPALVEFTHLGFPAYFRVKLSWANACAGAGAAQGVGLRRLRHQPRLGASRPHSVGDGPEMWGWAAATGVLWGLSYFFWSRLQATLASA